jgi:DNA-binding NarL/FixJ family response regulator
VTAASEPTDGHRVRVLVADDHPVFRRGLCELLATTSEVEVVGQAATGAEAVLRALELAPDVVVMDLNMPDLDGIVATRTIVSANPQVKVAVLTMLEDDEALFAALQAGASAYLLKDADDDELIRTVIAVAEGRAVFGAAVARRVIDHFRNPTVASSAAFPELSQREHEVLALLADGETNSTIARRLGIADKTVRNHVSNILTKLQVQRRAEAIVRARRAGLGTSGP